MSEPLPTRGPARLVLAVFVRMNTYSPPRTRLRAKNQNSNKTKAELKPLTSPLDIPRRRSSLEPTSALVPSESLIRAQAVAKAQAAALVRVTSAPGTAREKERVVKAKALTPDGSASSGTGWSPKCKRNRREVMELKLSKEEAAMKGAPEGPVYQVDVLETRDFEPSSNPQEEVAVVVTACSSSTWADQYAGIDSLRRLAIFHHAHLLSEERPSPDGGLLLVALPFLTECIGSLRSSMIRNALLALKDLYTFVGRPLEKFASELGPAVEAALQRCAGDKKFICASATAALEAGAKNGPPMEMLLIAIPAIDDKRPEVCSMAAVLTETCLGSIGVGSASSAGSGLPEGIDMRSLLQALCRAADGKNPEGRSAAVRALGRCRRSMGAERFEQGVRNHLSDLDAQKVLRVVSEGSNNRMRKGASSSSRLSLREQMIASRRLHKSQGGGSTLDAMIVVEPGESSQGGAEGSSASRPSPVKEHRAQSSTLSTITSESRTLSNGGEEAMIL